jgi:hypothetical protein
VETTDATTGKNDVADDHPFRYDVEWVLGGKSSNLMRVELNYTTADAEGMTDDANRSRRKRKPSTFLQDATMDVTKKTTKKATAEKKKATVEKKHATATAKSKKLKTGEKKVGSTAAASKKVKSDEGPTKAASSGARKRKVSEITTSTTTNGSKQKKTKAGTDNQRDVAADSTTTSAGMDLYERHRREFERIVTRLEKLDPFGFFKRDPPPEFDEQYYPTSSPLTSASDGNSAKDVHNNVEEGDPVKDSTTAPTETTQEPAVCDAQFPLANVAKVAKLSKKKLRESTEPIFPSHPPFNWKMVRRRMEHNRYVLDREYQEEEERFRQLAPYYKSMGLRRKRPATKKTTKTVPNRKKKLNSRVLHAKGVDWELFLKDVTGMCDAAVACESKVTGGSGTISVTASKIKEVCGAAMT